MASVWASILRLDTKPSDVKLSAAAIRLRVVMLHPDRVLGRKLKEGALDMCMRACRCVYAPTDVSIHPSIHLAVYLPADLSVYPST